MYTVLHTRTYIYIYEYTHTQRCCWTIVGFIVKIGGGGVLATMRKGNTVSYYAYRTMCKLCALVVERYYVALLDFPLYWRL